MDKICSLLSTEHGPQMRITSSCSPNRTSPIGTEEAPRESRAASLYGFSTGTIASTPGIAAIGFSRRSASGPMTPIITRDARNDPLDLFLGGIRLRDNDHISLGGLSE